MLCWRREHDDPVVPGARIPGFWPFILRSEVRPGWQFPPPLQPSPSPGSATASWYFDDTVPRWCIGAADFNIQYGRLQKYMKHKADPNLWPLLMSGSPLDRVLMLNFSEEIPGHKPFHNLNRKYWIYVLCLRCVNKVRMLRRAQLWPLFKHFLMEP